MDEMQITIRECFSDWVKNAMNARHMSQAKLARSSSLAETTISRVCRDSNDRGSVYHPTIEIVCKISIGLGLDRDETKELLFSAFPELEIWGYALDHHLDIFDVEEILYENGLYPEEDDDNDDENEYDDDENEN